MCGCISISSCSGFSFQFAALISTAIRQPVNNNLSFSNHLKKYFIIAAFFIWAAFLFSCTQNVKQKESKVESTTSVTSVAEKAISVELKGTLRSRRSYSNIQFMDNEKEIDDYLAKQEKSNPEIHPTMSKDDSVLFERFEQLGFIKDYSFLLKRFKPLTKSSNILQTFPGDIVHFKFYNDSATGHICFKAFYKSDSLQINTGATTLQNLDYAFLDVIPGGNKELVFLDDYYIMNGDNFDFLVYEIKTKH